MSVRRSNPSDAPTGVRLKAAVSVSEMARSLRLSRARFYELIESGVMPPPVYLIRTKRPYYPAELQAVCLRVRESGEGINGEPVVFYAARSSTPVPKTTRKNGSGSRASRSDPEIESLLNGLKQLGMNDPDPSAVEAIVAEMYPSGIGTEAPESLLTAVFRRLSRRN